MMIAVRSSGGQSSDFYPLCIGRVKINAFFIAVSFPCIVPDFDFLKIISGCRHAVGKLISQNRAVASAFPWQIFQSADIRIFFQQYGIAVICSVLQIRFRPVSVSVIGVPEGILISVQSRLCTFVHSVALAVGKSF